MMEMTDEESKRVQALHKLKLLDKPVEERFAKIVRLVRRHFRVGTATITLIDEARAYFLAEDGWPGPREACPVETRCNEVVVGKRPLIVNDLSADTESPSYKMVVENLEYQFYAGVPIVDPDGYAVGALCVLDRTTREFTREDLESLADFASIVEDEMSIKRADSAYRALISQVEKLRLKAFVDPLTNVWNRRAIFELLGRETARAERSDTSLSICMLDLDHFKEVNDEHGHLIGDQVLIEAALRLNSSVRDYDAIGRYGGEEFLVVLPEANLEQATKLAERLRLSVSSQPFDTDKSRPITVTVSIGVAQWQTNGDIKSLIGWADKALYEAKNKGRNRVESHVDSSANL